MKFKQLTQVLVITLMLTACGSDNVSSNTTSDTPSSNPTNAPTETQNDSICSQTFVNEYNAVIRKLKAATTEFDAREVRQDAIDFKAKYNGMKCKASVYDMNLGYSKNIEVNVNERVDIIIDGLNKILDF